MGESIDSIVALIRILLTIGLGGGLVDLTVEMRKSAATAHQRGLISLKSLNDQLIGKAIPRGQR